MVSTKYILVFVFVFLVALFSVGFFFIGDMYGLNHLENKPITPTQAANAMQQDNFYSNYRENTLEITGVINSIKDSGSFIGFDTTSSYETTCNLTSKHTSLHLGDKITIITEGARASREIKAVALEDCIII